MTTVLPPMNSLSDVVALKRFDMEAIERKRRCFYPMTPKVVPWNVNTERPETYFPNISRTYITDLTYIPGTAQKKRFNPNIVNREASWSPYMTVKPKYFSNPDIVAVEEDDDNEDEEKKFLRLKPSLADPIHKPKFRISRPLGLLSREYKHPLAMYEAELNNSYSRYIQTHRMSSHDPTTPQQYYKKAPTNFYRYAENTRGPGTAGKEWVTNRWRLWSGGSASSVR